MELSITKQPVAINETILDTSLEQPVECDVLLPDYCPDIVRILNCQGTGVVTDTEVRGDKLALEGMTTVVVCYLGEEGGVRRTEYKLPFSRTLDLKSNMENLMVSTDVQMQYLNCRALSPRKMDIRGALMIKVKATRTREEEAVYEADGMGMQLRREEEMATRICARTTRMITVREELELGYGKPSATSVVFSRCCAVPSDSKAIGGKLVIKGELAFHLLYEHDGEGRMETMDYQLPMSQIIDLPCAEEGTRCDVDLKVVSCDVTLKQELDGQARQITLDATIAACVTVYEDYSISAGVDGYSTCCESKMVNRPLSICRLMSMVDERCTHKQTVTMTNDFDRIIDTWCTVSAISARAEQGTMVISATLLLQMFTENEKMIDYSSNTMEFTHRMQCDTGGEMMEYTPRLSVLGTSFSMTGVNTIDVRCELMLNGAIMSTKHKNLITDIQLDMAKQIERDPAVGLTIYFAQKGESVWEIGKRYRLPAQAIMRDNGLDDDILEGKTALIIPIV